MELQQYVSDQPERARHDLDAGARREPPATTLRGVPRAGLVREARREDFPLIEQLRSQWKLLVWISVVACVLGIGVSLQLPKEYEAEAQIMVSVNSSEDVAALSLGNNFSQERLQTYIAVATSRPVMEKVIAELELNETPTGLAERVSAEAVPETVLLRVVARDSDPRLAAQIADSLAAALMTEIDEIERADGQATALVRTVLVEDATIPSEPSAPSVPRNAVLALLGGLGGSVLFVLLRGILDTRIRSTEHLAEDFGIPLFASIPRDSKHASDPMVLANYDNEDFSEAYRLLRTRLRYANTDGRLDAIMITSVGECEGKSSVSSLLAAALAESGLNVLLIDGDLRRPTIAKKFGLEEAAGLSAVLTRQATLDEAVQRSVGVRVDVLAAGILPPNPAELLESQSMRDLISEAKRKYDMLIIDTPPITASVDATSLSVIADAVLLVVRTDGKVTKHAIRRSLIGMNLVGSRVLGMVATFTKADGSNLSSYYRNQRRR